MEYGTTKPSKRAKKGQALADQLAKKIERWYSYWNSNNENYRQWTKFNLGEQWDDATLLFYRQNGKVVITKNFLYMMIKQIVGEQLQNTPALKVMAGSNVPQDLVSLREDLIKSICFESKSDEIFQHAFLQAMVGGYGAFRLATDYESPESFDQVIRYKKIDEPTTCYWDPLAKEKTKSDGNVCGFTVQMTRDEFEDKYPNKNFVQSFWVGEYDPRIFIWGDAQQETITIAHSYCKKYFKKTIVEFDDGTIIEKKDLSAYLDQWRAEQSALQELQRQRGQVYFIPPEPQVIDERTSDDYKIVCYKHTRNEILETYDWPSKELPVKFVDGDSSVVDGRQVTKSFSEFGRDAQKEINYYASEIVQYVKNARSENYLATEEQIADYIDQWKNPERNYGPLMYKASRTGEAAPIPVPPIPIPAALLEAYQTAKMDLMILLGRTEAALGMQGNEVSGAAVDARVTQQNQGSFVQFDNLNKAIEDSGRCIDSLIPTIYSRQRLVNIFADENETKQITVNQPNPITGQIENDLTTGKFLVKSVVAPSFEAQRRNERDFLTGLIQLAPQAAPLVLDQMAKLTDSEITPTLIERLETLVPAPILAKEKGLPPPPPQPNPALIMQQQEMQLKQADIQIKAQKVQNDAQANAIKAAQLQEQSMTDRIKANAEVMTAGIDAGAKISKAAVDAHNAVHGNIQEYAKLFHSMSQPYQSPKQPGQTQMQ